MIVECCADILQSTTVTHRVAQFLIVRLCVYNANAYIYFSMVLLFGRMRESREAPLRGFGEMRRPCDKRLDFDRGFRFNEICLCVCVCL